MKFWTLELYTICTMEVILMKKSEVGIPEKYCLTLEEAAIYFNIGVKRLRALAESPQGYTFIVMVGCKRLIKRRKFEEFLDGINAV